jgi:hypothetical protein
MMRGLWISLALLAAAPLAHAKGSLSQARAIADVKKQLGAGNWAVKLVAPYKSGYRWTASNQLGGGLVSLERGTVAGNGQVKTEISVRP